MLPLLTGHSGLNQVEIQNSNILKLGLLGALKLAKATLFLTLAY